MTCQFGPADWQLVLVEAIYEHCGPCEYDYLVCAQETKRRARVPASLLEQPWQCVCCKKPFATEAQCKYHEQYQCGMATSNPCDCKSLDTISARTKADEIWPIYKVKYDKEYDAAEDKKRFETFKQNVKKIAENNKKWDAGGKQNCMSIGRGADSADKDDPNEEIIVIESN